MHNTNIYNTLVIISKIMYERNNRIKRGEDLKIVVKRHNI